MHRQVGPRRFDEEGLSLPGLLVHHLVMPAALEETRHILRWVADELGVGTYVNIMDEYYPVGLVSPTSYPELHRRVTGQEFQPALAEARTLGLWRLDRRWRPVRD